MKWFDNTALTIVIIGAVNWLLVGIFRFDLVAFLFGNLSWLSRIIYTIVGICGLYLISLYGRMKDMTDVCSYSRLRTNQGVSYEDAPFDILF